MLPAPASGFILSFGATGKLLPPTTSGVAVQSLQPFLPRYHAGFKRDTPLSNIFIPLWMFAWLKAEHMPSSCVYSGGTDSALVPLRIETCTTSGDGGGLGNDGPVYYYLIKDTNAARHTIKCKLSRAVFVFSFLSADCVSCVGCVQSLMQGWRLTAEFRHFQAFVLDAHSICVSDMMFS